MEINVNISELKRRNEIIEIPHEEIDEIHEVVPQKVDNDMEDSDLGFS